MNLIFSLFQTWILQATADKKFQFKLGKKSSSSNSIFQTKNCKKQLQRDSRNKYTNYWWLLVIPFFKYFPLTNKNFIVGYEVKLNFMYGPTNTFQGSYFSTLEHYREMWMWVVVFAKVRRTSKVSADFETFLVHGPLLKQLLSFIFCGSSVPDKNSKSIGDNTNFFVKTQLSKKFGW